jgi:hypothetical protein
VIVTNPKDTVVVMLFEKMLYKEIGFHVKAFSTKPFAMKFLKEAKLASIYNCDFIYQSCQ